MKVVPVQVNEKNGPFERFDAKQSRATSYSRPGVKDERRCRVVVQRKSDARRVPTVTNEFEA